MGREEARIVGKVTTEVVDSLLYLAEEFGLNLQQTSTSLGLGELGTPALKDLTRA